jgi:hypothetical protein
MFQKRVKFFAIHLTTLMAGYYTINMVLPYGIGKDSRRYWLLKAERIRVFVMLYSPVRTRKARDNTTFDDPFGARIGRSSLPTL